MKKKYTISNYMNLFPVNDIESRRKELAEKLGISEDRLGRIIHAKIGTNVNAKVNQLTDIWDFLNEKLELNLALNELLSEDFLKWRRSNNHVATAA